MSPAKVMLRIIVGGCLLIFSLPGLPLSARESSDSRTERLLYNVDFSWPPHFANQAPLTGAGDSTRVRPTTLIGNPLIVDAAGSLNDIPCSLDEGPLSRNGLTFVTGTGYNGFSEDWIWYEFCMDILVFDITSSSNLIVRLKDSNGEQLDFDFKSNNDIRFFPAPGPSWVGTYTNGVPLNFKMELDLWGGVWNLYLDNSLASSFTLDLVDFASLSVELDRFSDADSAAVDNIRICGGGGCTVDPWITSQPQSLVVCDGLQADFYVTATGTTPINYQWYYEGDSILGAGNNHYWIYPISPADEGEYWVKVYNSVDTLISSSAFLTVSTPANSPQVAYSPADTVVNNGDHVRFSSGAVGTPQLGYQWYFGGNPIAGANDTLYTVYFAGLADEGDYQMGTTDGCGATTLSNPAALTVNTAITLSLLSDLEVCVGNPITFSIIATGSPTITYQWYTSSGPIGGATGSSYTISSAAMTDRKQYWVVATNQQGSATSTRAFLWVYLNSIVVPDPVYPISTIQSALEFICPNGGTIALTDGVYQGARNRDIDFLGKNVHLYSQSGNPEACIVDCQGWTRGFNFITGESSAAILEGITIRNGDPGTYDSGGAIYCVGSSPTILNCVMEYCTGWNGGAIAASGFYGTIQNCTFTMNTASSKGGAIYLYGNSEPIGGIGGCTLIANSAFHGGGICLDEYANLSTLTHSIIGWSSRGEAVACFGGGGIWTVFCSDIYNNAGGNWIGCLSSWVPPANSNLETAARFCDLAGADFTLADVSPCAPANSPCGELIGAWPVNCWPLADDDGVMEYGIEWIKNYRYSSDLACCETIRNHYTTELTNSGWSEGFDNKDGEAQLDHWGENEENDWVDDVDLSFFCGHGVWTFDSDHGIWLHGPGFRENAYVIPIPDYEMAPGDATDRWGERDAEWLAFTSCSMLGDYEGKYWAEAFNGAHLILGYKTVANARYTTFNTWVDQMISHGPGDPAKRVGWSWCKGCDFNQDYSRVARVLGESLDMQLDYLWGQGLGPQMDPVDDTTYRLWDHNRGGPFVMPELAARGLVGSMNYYQVIPQSLDYDDVEYLASLFGIYGNVEDYGDGNFYMEDGPKYLTVNQTAGIDYGNLARLWVPRATAPSLPSLEDAETIAVGFLNASGLLPADTEDSPTVIHSDIQSLRDKATGEVVGGVEFPTDIQVSYRRELNGFPVMGGGGLLAYVGEGSVELSGMTKTWRELNDQGMISLLDSSTALDYFHTYGGRLILGNLSYMYDSLTVQEVGQGYYEAGFGTAEDYVFPVYLLNCELYRSGNSLGTHLLYFPAAELFMPLVAELTSPIVDYILVLNENVLFAGGGVFGTIPYNFSWNSDLDGNFGSTGSFEYSSLTLGDHIVTFGVWDNDGEFAEEQFDLTVTDQVDFGDAPDPGYPTLLASNGARHVNDGVTFLGSAIDNELEGQPNATASGDDIDGTADEDGVIFTTTLSPGSTADITVTASVAGYLNAWVDFNSDDDWDDTGEQVFTDTTLVSGLNTLSFMVPLDAMQDTTYARFRFDSRGGLGYDGMAPDGEVEDYLLLFGCELDSLEGCLPENEPCGLRLNNGCNLDPPVFIPIQEGDVYCAESWADTLWRDSDWYELVIDQPAQLEINFSCEFEMLIGLIAQEEPGVEGCANLYDYADVYSIVQSCENRTFTTELPTAGYYYLIALPLVYEGYPCVNGPYMYHLGIDLLGLQPQVYIAVEGDTATLNWEPVIGTDYYKVYSATEPFADFPGGWNLETPAPPGVADTTWTDPITVTEKFYRVVAVRESLLSGTGQAPRFDISDRLAAGEGRKPSGGVGKLK